MSPVERDLVEEQREAQRRNDAALASEPLRSRGGMDAGTKRLALVAGGLGALLVAGVGGWSLLGHHPAGIPVVQSLPGPVRVKPVDPGGMQLMGAQVAQTNGPAAQALAPGPEEAAPQTLQAEVDAARHADAPSPPPVARTVVPVPVPVATPPGVTAPAAIVAPPVVAGTDAPVAAPARPVPATRPEPEPAAPVAPAATTGAHAVQLAALDNDAAAHVEWSRLSKRAPQLFGHRAPTIVRVDRGGKSFFRLRTGGFASTADATAFCAKAKLAGIACTVADF